MDLTWTADQQHFRDEARTWLTRHVPRDLPSGDTAEGFDAILAFEKQMFDARWAVVSWPEAYGGRGASVWEWLIFEDEYYRAGGPSRVTQNGIFLLAPAIFAFGTQEQKDTILPRMAAGLDVWAQGWSEPNSGSDLASLTSRARRDDVRGGWVINGQKTWTTRGAFCTHVFGLFRTDPESQRHRGLTYFLIPLDAPGITVRGFDRYDGDQGFAEVFFEDVFVEDGAVLGAVGEGWKVAMATAGSERGLTLRSPGRFLATFERLLGLAKQHEGSAVVRDRIAASWVDVRAYEVATWSVVTRITEGHEQSADASLSKIHWSEMDIRMHELALHLMGSEAALESTWTRGHSFALAGPIYAGTNEIQRNIIAERLLGLPRS